MAGAPGFEPRLTESESAVLPLNYAPPNNADIARFFMQFYKSERKVLQIRGGLDLYRAIRGSRLLSLDDFEALPPIGSDGHLIAKPHIVVDRLARHADVVADLVNVVAFRPAH